MNFTETTPLPRLRHDIGIAELIPGIITLYDEMGYTETTVQLPLDVIDYLLYMDGKRNVLELAGHAVQAGRPFDSEKFLEVVEILDEEGFLDTEAFREYQDNVHHEYNSLTVRPPFLAGLSYPEDPDELREMLDELLKGAPDFTGLTIPDGFFIPHIDIRIGGEAYGTAYNALRRTKADTFILLGVPHQMSYDRFMISEKDFDTPLGLVPTDREFIRHFREKLSFDLTTDEIAHRQEHSIEFQTLFLRHLFPDRSICIVPILVGPLFEYVEYGRGGAEKDSALTELYMLLGQTAIELKRNVCWIASVDFCHVGKKFGDPFEGQSVLQSVKEHDERLIQEATRCNAESFLQNLVEVKNHYKVCGVSPMYTMLRAASMQRGELLAYDQWDEVETESSISFASMAFYQ